MEDRQNIKPIDSINEEKTALVFSLSGLNIFHISQT